ncbi:hypothetical protein HNQ77_005169 [Silvibacterium bohemicum]|uniref:Uncharacterized protein n=1 Tax=Silvibacterium bohemicum TaxID=1577686 RepID=A0A841K2E3_9BACT|nr:hypothetical protein [Silvibacterium bohemicum]MBB6147175.1 hypothetical protein [Silvibacterium bohemicum]
MNPNDYLHGLFEELQRLKPCENCPVAHAIYWRDNKLFALVSVGDFRERVPLDFLDSNPKIAAATIFARWQEKAARDGNRKHPSDFE